MACNSAIAGTVNIRCGSSRQVGSNEADFVGENP